MGESFPDGSILHAADPEPGKGFCAAALVIDKPENQFALAPCVRSADHAVHIRAVHQFLQDAKLLFGGRRHQILPLLRQDGQVCDAPLDVLGIVDIGWCKLHQVPHAPADEVMVALQVAIPTFADAQGLGNGLGYRGLFSYNQVEQSDLSFLS